jgi:thymidine kinase
MGRLELIVGPMFSGKTTKLLKLIDMYKDDIFVITHSFDTRYGTNKITNHNKQYYEANISCTNLMPLLNSEQLMNYKYIAIEEGQFFNDLHKFALYLVQKLDKHVFIAGLNGDYKMNPFKNIVNLISYADKTNILYAKCSYCDCDAPFTKRITSSTKKILVGSNDLYKPCCRMHYDVETS